MASDTDVTLVALESLTPYHEGEVFTVTKEQADMLLTPNFTPTDFGPKYPIVKVRRFDPDRDRVRLLNNRVLNQVEHAKLEKELAPGTRRNPSPTE